VSYQDLLNECDRDGVGALLWERLLDVARQVACDHSPHAFNGRESWSEETICELAQEVAVNRLLGENQLDYVLYLAADNGSLNRLLTFQVLRVLAHRRAVTVADRLLARIRRLDLESDYRTLMVSTDLFVLPKTGGREPTSLSNAELHRGCVLINSIPRLASGADAHPESEIYNRCDLAYMLSTLVHEFNGILLEDVRRILEMTLTSWLPTSLHGQQGDRAKPLTPEEEARRSELKALIGGFATDLGPEYRAVLRGKAQGMRDGELASRLCRSR